MPSCNARLGREAVVVIGDTMPRMPLHIHKNHRVRCPYPTCRMKQPADTVRAIDSHGLGRCACGQQFLLWVRGPFAVVLGLSDIDADRYDRDKTPLDVILREQGWLEDAA